MKTRFMRLRALLTFERGVLVLVALNLIDAASTHLALHLGFATELNPVMRWAYGLGPEFFWVMKMLLVSGGMVLIGRLATEKVANSVLAGAAAIYILVIAIHAHGWYQYLMYR